jgi:hypothetical protein
MIMRIAPKYRGATGAMRDLLFDDGELRDRDPAAMRRAFDDFLAHDSRRRSSNAVIRRHMDE